MFKWLEKRAAKQSLLNVGINTRTLIVVSNRADAAIQETGASNPDDATKVTQTSRTNQEVSHAQCHRLPGRWQKVQDAQTASKNRPQHDAEGIPGALGIAV